MYQISHARLPINVVALYTSRPIAAIIIVHSYDRRSRFHTLISIDEQLMYIDCTLDAPCCTVAILLLHSAPLYLCTLDLRHMRSGHVRSARTCGIPESIIPLFMDHRLNSHV